MVVCRCLSLNVGYSHDTGACHSVSLVRLEHADYTELCPVAPGTAAGTVNIGNASTHETGDCSQHSWEFCDAEFDSPACNPENIYEGVRKGVRRKLFKVDLCNSQ